MKLLLVLAACVGAVLAKNRPIPLKSPLQFIPVTEDLSRIVGGSNADPNEFPWQASLQLSSGGWFHICGGSLIAPDVVVTAAHCIDGLGQYTFRVVLGDHQLSKVEGTEQTRTVIRRLMHPNYNANGNGIPNDIGLLFLESPVTIVSNVVETVPMASAWDTFTSSDDCSISGWGNTIGGSNPNTPADTLQVTQKTVMTNSECGGVWGNAIRSYHICINNPASSACMGDSGGPLVCQKNGVSILAGVTSWGSSTCSVSLPNVYTRVSSFESWLNTNMATRSTS